MKIEIETIFYIGTAIMLALSITIIFMFYFLYNKLTQMTKNKTAPNNSLPTMAGDE